MIFAQYMRATVDIVKKPAEDSRSTIIQTYGGYKLIYLLV